MTYIFVRGGTPTFKSSAKPVVIDSYKAGKLAAKETERFEDRQKGLTRAKGPERGDYDSLRKVDNVLGDYAKFKNPNDREKIKNEYFGLQKEMRKE